MITLCQLGQTPMKLWRYCLAIAIPTLLFSVAVFLVVDQRASSIQRIIGEISGIKVTGQLYQAMSHLQEMRGLWQLRLQGADVTGQIEEKKETLDSLLGDLIVSSHVTGLSIHSALEQLRWEIGQHETHLPGGDSPETLFQIHSEFVERILELMQLSAIRSKLVLDPDVQTHHLMELLIKRLPETAEAIGRLRGSVSGLTFKEQLTKADHLLIQGRRSSLIRELNNLLRSYQASHNEVDHSLHHEALEVQSFVDATLMLEKNVLAWVHPEGPTDGELAFYEAATKVLEQGGSLHREGTAQVIELLEQRVKQHRDFIVGAFALAIVLGVLVAYFVYGFYRANTALFGHLLRSVHEQKEATRALHDGETRNRAIVNAALDGIVTIDQEGRVIEFNASAEEIFGYKNESVLGRDIADLIIPEKHREQHRKGLKRFLDTRTSNILRTRVELSALRVDGSLFPIELTITPIKLRGKIIFTAFIRDITERTLLQKQLQHAQKMETVGQLTGGVAHEFNNILSSVLGFTDLARDELKDYANPKTLGYLNHVTASASRARDLVAQMMAFNQGGEGKLEPMVLLPVIENSLKMLSPSLPSSLKIEFAIEDEQLTTATNAIQLQQLIMNLCINARDATQGRGRVTVGLRQYFADNEVCSSCREKFSGVYLELSVQDNGIGINPSEINRIFDPFYTTKEVGEGTGMGLSMVHGIMHAHNGHVVAVSNPGHGSCFSLLFPLELALAQVSEGR